MLNNPVNLNRPGLLLILIFLSLTVHTFSVPAEQISPDHSEMQGQVVSAVTVLGNRRVERELIELNINTKPGDLYSLERAREDIKRVYRLGYFENVYLETEKKEQNIEVFYVVNEKPVIVDLRFSGNDKVNDGAIEEVIQITEGEIIDFRKVDLGLNAIKDLYKQRGFVGTNIDYDIEPEGDGKITLAYNISEGKKAYIKRVVFVGNDNIEDKVFEKRIYSRSKGFMSFLTKKGLYNIDEISRDRDRLKATYLDIGYLDVSVGSPEITYLEDEEGYLVKFSIQEGPQYRIDKVLFEGDFSESPKILERVTRSKPGEIFSSSEITNDITRLTRYFGNQGFAFANVAPQFAVDREDLLVTIKYQVEKGNKVYVRYIDIIGNVHTRDQVIRREVIQQEQSLYRANSIDFIRARVARLGFFENDVQVEQNRVAGEDDLLDIVVKVNEKPTGFFSVSGGFSSVENFIFSGQVRENNLFGYGKTLFLNSQIGGVTKLLSLRYSDPNFWGSEYTFDSTLFYNDREFRDFDRKSWGVSTGVGKLLYRNLIPRVSYRFENVKISDVDRDARLIITESDRTISSFSFSLVWDSRNNFLDPTKGNLTSTTIEYAGPFGGNTDFIKYTLLVRQWVPLWYGTYVSFRGIYGLLDLKNTGNDLVVSERFFLGGPNILRGFGFRRVGTRVTTEDGDYIIIGGVQQMVLSADYLFPILRAAGLRGVLFYEMGNVFNDGEKLSFDPSDLRKDYGFGLRWLSPLGPMKLEIGIPIGDRLPDEESYEVQFTIGSVF